MKIQIEWGDSKFKNGSSFDIVEETNTNNLVKIKVSYTNEKIRKEGYDKGDLIISVKGIGAANRSEVIEATVGADKASEPTKSRDWSYTWNKANDMYTFTNNHPIKGSSVYSGYFELVYNFNSRETIHNYKQKDIEAEMLLPDGTSASSDTLIFTHRTKCDTFAVDLENGALYSYEGFKKYVENASEYFFIKYNLGSSKATFSRGLNKKGEIYHFIPDKTLNDSRIKVFSPVISCVDQNDGSWKVETSTSNSITKQYLYVGYPKDTYAGKTISAKYVLNGEFYEGNDKGETGVKRLAEKEKEIVIPADFSFSDIPGPVYDLRKENDYNESSQEIIERGGMLKGSLMELGTSQRYYLEGELNVSNGNRYTLDIVDDFQYITQKNGDYRKLGKEDYHFERIQIPSVTDLININGYPIANNKYTWKVYAATNGEVIEENDTTFVKEGILNTSAPMVTLPKGTTSFAIRIENIEETITEYSIPVDINYHLKEEKFSEEKKTNLTSGQVVNLSFIRIYDKDGHLFNEMKRENYEDFGSNLDLPQQDLDLYGQYLDRERANITFYTGEKQDYTATTGISEIKYENKRHTTSYFMGARFDSNGNEERPKKFSMYSLLPKKVVLDGYSEAEDIWSIMKLSGFDLSEEALAAHCTPEVISDYKGTGQQYIALHFDFGDIDLANEHSLTATFPLLIKRGYFTDEVSNVQVNNQLFIDEPIDAYTTKKTTDKQDFDEDGDAKELMSAVYDQEDYIYAKSSQLAIVKLVKTQYTSDYTTEKAKVEFGKDYSYNLEITNGANITKDLVVMDKLETDSESQWKGVFQSVDLSDAEQKGLTGTIWYSAKESPGKLNSNDWVKKLEPEKVKAIAIDFGKQQLKPGIVLSVIVNMKATNDRGMKEKTANNHYTSDFTMVDNITQEETIQSDLKSNVTKIVPTAKLRRITITKVDEISEEPLSQAEVVLIRKSDGKVIETLTTNAKGQAVFKDVPEDETYIIRETRAPYGYQIAEEKEVSFSGENIKLKLKDPRKTGSLELFKYNDSDRDLPVSGGTYALYNSKGEKVKSAVTNESGRAFFDNLEWGNYTVKETKAPEGYLLNENSYRVTINRENVVTMQQVKTFDKQEDTLVTITKLEKDTKGVQLTTTISGVPFKLYRVLDQKEEFVADYVTDKNGEILINELIYGDYVLKETRSPAGYQKSEDLTFTLSPNNKTPSISVYNQRKPGEVLAVKNDNLNNVVKGAVYDLYDEDKTQILGSYKTDDSGNFKIKDLEWGTYYLKEKYAPEGYMLDSEFHKIVIDRKHLQVTQKLINETQKGSVELLKTDETGMIPLSNAQYGLYKSDGSFVYGFSTDRQGKISVEGLEWGSYYFEELYPPNGYQINSEKIRFTVNAENARIKQELTTTDPREGAFIQIIKYLRADDINFNHGNPSFLYKITGTDIYGKEHTYHRMISFDQQTVDASTEGGVVVNGTTVSLPPGIYEVIEESSGRYKTMAIQSSDSIVKGKDRITIDLTDYLRDQVSFFNDKYEHQDFSHTGARTNIIKPLRKMTNFSVRWNGDDVVSAGSMIERSKLEAKVYYDDGSVKTLGEQEYSLSRESLPNVNGDYLIDVSYTENGITKKDSFILTIKDGVKKRIDHLEAHLWNEDPIPIRSEIRPYNMVVSAVYNDGEVKGLSSYSEIEWDPLFAPNTEGEFDVTITLNQTLYPNTAEISTTVKMTSYRPEPLLSKSKFRSKISKINEYYKVVFTDKEVPVSVSISDLSEKGNKSVVGWYEETTKTFFVSSNGNGKVIFPKDCSSFIQGRYIKECYFEQVDTSNVTSMESMFNDCKALISIYISDLWNIDKVINSSNMFYGCTSIIGYSGTRYDENKRDVNMANWETGYLNYKPASTP